MSELKEPRVGEEAPGFTLPNQNGEEIFLGDFRGRKVVLYFYPKDFTSGCTKEACSFRDSYSDFQEENTVILGISKDSVESHKKFETRYGLPFMLLSDKDADVAKMYGVWKEKNMYGRKY
ncbi:MAG: peroxiredoxin, partial [Candidatus Geothermarchaeales archaeon]